MFASPFHLLCGFPTTYC